MRGLLVVGVAMLALGCGGGGDAPAARSTTKPSPTATASSSPTATIARRGLRLQRIGTFDSPVYVTSPPGDRRRLFVVEQGGYVRIVRGGKTLDRPFLAIPTRISSGAERGLLSLAFAPDYASSGRFYVHYTAPDGDVRIAEYRRASAERADHDSERVLVSVPHPASNHNGGLVRFGPDGLLYAGIGDGGGAGDPGNNAQDRGTLLGKIIRMDPRRSDARPEIYAYGLRNPWRFAFTPRGHIVVADVGQGEVEEVTVIRRKGANLGWRVWEGRRRYASGTAPGHVPPAIQRFHSNGNCSITGGVVVRDPVLAALRGRYVFADFCRGRIESARLRGNRARDVRTSRLYVPNLSSFGEDARRRVYVTSLNGPVFRLVPR